MTTVSGTPAQITVLTEGIQGPPGPPGQPGDSIVAAARTSPALLTDLVPVVRSNTIFLVTVADLLAATGGPAVGGRLDFSTPGNSGLAAGAM